jgi:hypothetical protein
LANDQTFYTVLLPENRGSSTAKPWEFDRSSSGGWFERSETFEYLGQLLSTFLEELFPEMT